MMLSAADRDATLANVARLRQALPADQFPWVRFVLEAAVHLQGLEDDMPITPPAGDLARCVTHEADQEWPTMIEIVAYWGEGRKGRRRSIQIDADQFYGRGGWGAPMTGEQLINMVERVRRQGPEKR